MLPVKAYFFSLSDDNAPSPYLVSLASSVYNFVYYMYMYMVSHSRIILSESQGQGHDELLSKF